MPVRVADHIVVVMALDGEPAEPIALKRARIVLAPGNRADLFVELVLAPGASAPILVDTGRGEIEVARLVYAKELGRGMAGPSPRALPPNPLPEKMDLARALRVETLLESGGALWKPGAPFDAALFSVKRGRAVVLALANRTQVPQAVHLHGHHFRLLDALDDGWKPYWLDTVLVRPGQTQRIALVADNPGRWLIEASAIAPRGRWTTTWFEVT